jgi:hypothetical protein
MEQLLREELAKFNPAVEVPWERAAVYAEFVAQTYYYVCHSTRLLGLAAGRIGVAHEKLHQRFLKHAAEERSHHLLAQRDLTALGRELSAIPERAATSALYQTQYYQIEHVSPVALLGYILALEGVAVVHGPAAFERIRTAHGASATSFLRLHAEEDPDHLPRALAQVAQLESHERAIVTRNLKASCALYRAFLRSIVVEAGTA